MNDKKKIQLLTILNRKPRPGDIIVSKDGSFVPIFVEIRPSWKEGEEDYRLMFTNCKIDEECTGWYLTSSDGSQCLKLLILPRSQEKLISSNGGSMNGLRIDRLRVCKCSAKGTSLLCEVVEEQEE